MPDGARIDTRELAALRRRLKEVDPEVGKALRKELSNTARVVARVAASLSVHKSGTFAAGWKPSVTLGRGASVRNAVVYAGQQEYGAKVWLRRGLPYRDSTPGPVAATGRNGATLPMRQVSLGGGMVVNEAQYLVKRSLPGHKAVEQELPRSLARVDAAARAAADRAL